mmetsp:Transcript_6408/g.22558  ORF Transcript_6408/g.22558 Transcript_6408/m.22558 type:complete len:538 (+) Transcript_6408:1081-2694(+)
MRETVRRVAKWHGVGEPGGVHRGADPGGRRAPRAVQRHGRRLPVRDEPAVRRRHGPRVEVANRRRVGERREAEGGADDGHEGEEGHPPHVPPHHADALQGEVVEVPGHELRPRGARRRRHEARAPRPVPGLGLPEGPVARLPAARHLEEDLLQGRDGQSAAHHPHRAPPLLEGLEQVGQRGRGGQREAEAPLAGGARHGLRLRRVRRHQRGQLLRAAAPDARLRQRALQRVPHPVLRLEEQGAAHALHPAVGHDRHPVAQQVRLVHVVRREQHDAALLRLLYKLPRGTPGVWVHPARGLVQDDHPAAPDERDGERELALHPAGQRARLRPRLLREAHPALRLLGLPPHLPRADALEGGEELQVLAHGERLEEDVVLRAHAHVLSRQRQRLSDADAQHLRVAARRGEQPREHADGRALASPVVPEHSCHLPLVHGQREAIHRDAGGAVRRGEHLVQALQQHASALGLLRPERSAHGLLHGLLPGKQGLACPLRAAAAAAAAARPPPEARNPVGWHEREPRREPLPVLPREDPLEVRPH